MKNDITGIVRARMIDEKISALEEMLALLKSDLSVIMENYMRISGELFVGADLDDRSGDVIITVHAKAREVYECGRILKA